ncbi:unnamed protein product [Echinostoma caproni]|uniref:ALMS_motif domain-containing protein n=1 Tax=Echinostoma caproni TaxID=27848 RepID=A0A183A6H4_9TREM|nr:unnamed protein product [Echinostoma caproni]
MTTIPRRVGRGRKAVRTSTAPMLLSPSDRQKFLSNTPRATEAQLSPYASVYPSKQNAYESLLYGTDQSVSLYELNHSQAAGSQSPSQCCPSPQPWARTEVQSKYSLRQQLKEVMESRTPADSSKPTTQHHRRELTRCWSRERVIRSEVILSIRRPTGQSCDDLQSVGLVPPGTTRSGSMQSIMTRSTSGLPSSSHLIPTGQATSSPWDGSNHSLFGASTSPVSPLCAGRTITIRTVKHGDGETIMDHLEKDSFVPQENLDTRTALAPQLSPR